MVKVTLRLHINFSQPDWWLIPKISFVGFGDQDWKHTASVQMVPLLAVTEWTSIDHFQWSIFFRFTLNQMMVFLSLTTQIAWTKDYKDWTMAFLRHHLQQKCTSTHVRAHTYTRIWAHSNLCHYLPLCPYRRILVWGEQEKSCLMQVLKPWHIWTEEAICSPY